MWDGTPFGISAAMAAFVFASTAAPGPNAALMLAVGARVGIGAGATILLGMALANAGVKTLAAASIQGMVALDAVPVELVKWPALVVCAWMAWRILRRGGLRSGGARAARGLPLARFWTGLAFQCANPKVWVTSFAAAMLFAAPATGSTPHPAAFGVIALVAVVISAGAFLILGARHAERLSRPWATRALDLAVAAVLGLAVLPVLVS